MTLRVILYAAAALAFVIGAVVAIGYSLPKNHIATGEALVALPPEQVFGILTDVASYPSWRKVTAVEVLSQDPLRWRERAGGDVITFEVVDRRPSHRLEVKIADKDLPFGGSWIYELSPDTPGTRVRLTERGEVYNPLFRFVSRFIIGQNATIDAFLASLVAKGKGRR